MFLKKKAHNLFTKSLKLAVKGVKTKIEKKKEAEKPANVKKVNPKKVAKPEEPQTDGE